LGFVAKPNPGTLEDGNEQDLENLNQLGKQAWEAVAFSDNSDILTVLLKRLIPN